VIAAFAVLPIEVAGAETAVEGAQGLACPQLALPNYEGWGYAEVKLDDVSMNTIINDSALLSISDPLMRSMVWTALFDALGNAQMDKNQLLAFLVTNMPFETNDRIIRQTLSELVSNLNHLERLGDSFTFQLTTYSNAAEEQLWDLISRGVIAGADSQSESTLNLRLRYYRGIARSDTALNNLNGLLNDEVKVPGLNIGQGSRWEIINRLAERNYLNVRDLISDEQARDPSDAGRRAYFAAQSALPNLEIKQTWVERFLDTANPLPLSNQRAAMGSIFPPGQEELQLALLPRLTTDLTILAAEKDNYYLQSYGRDLFAGICSKEGLEIIAQAISEPDAIGPTLYRFMSENVQSAELCVASKEN
jgi:aminopeptidase N